MKKAIYAFSADPITDGHINIIERAAKIFDVVYAAIGINQEKEYTFSLNERIAMAKNSLKSMNNVKVVSFKGLLVDYAYEHNIPIIIKGIRNIDDFNYEKNLHITGKSQKLGVDTFILFSKPELSHVSSKVMKLVQKEHGLIHEYVPLHSKQALEEEISGQYILGITGEMGSGKTHVCEMMIDIAKKHGIDTHHIDLDSIGHQILEDLKEPQYKQIRKIVAETFGNNVKDNNGMINRKKLGDIVFKDDKQLKKLNEIMKTPLIVRLRRELYGKEGLILFDVALVAESDMTPLCNNNILLITSDDKTQEKRMRERGLNKEQIKRRLESQYSSKEKKRRIENKIKEYNHGRLWIMDSSNDIEEKKLEKIFNEIIKELKIKE